MSQGTGMDDAFRAKIEQALGRQEICRIGALMPNQPRIYGARIEHRFGS